LVDDIRQSMLEPGANRIAALGCLCTLLVGVMAGVGIWVVLVLSSGAHSFADRLAEAGVIFAGGTLALALIAAVVAVMAYAAATGQPDLMLQVDFPFSALNTPTFEARQKDEEGWLYTADYKQGTGVILLSNESVYSAKNPAVTVRLQNLYARTDTAALRNAGWSIIGFANTVGVTAVQWDGGPNYSVHGKSVRQLPPLELRQLRYPVDRGPASLEFVLLADGYRRKISMPVKILPPGVDRTQATGPPAERWL
jgi:hypothetical protein